MATSGANFGSLPGNNAPMPVFGGTNPTGMLPGGFDTKSSFNFPGYNMFGASGQPGGTSPSFITPEANQGIFGPTPVSGGGGNTGIQGLSSGFGTGGFDPNMLKQLQNDYGQGIGGMLAQILSGGLFNQKVADAYMNAMQPAYNRGISSTEQAFGAEGARFGSAAALGIGDFASQFTLNEQQVMANMYMQSQQEQLSLLENILPTVNKEQDNSMSSGWVSDLLGGLQIAGGVLAAPFTAGASLGLVSSGANMIAGANSGQGGANSQGAGIPNIG